jgi:hypothetical protein
MRTLAKTHIFVSKTSKSIIELKNSVIGGIFFSWGLKLQHFSTMALKTHIVANKNLKINF